MPTEAMSRARYAKLLPGRLEGREGGGGENMRSGEVRPDARRKEGDAIPAADVVGFLAES